MATTEAPREPVHLRVTLIDGQTHHYEVRREWGGWEYTNLPAPQRLIIRQDGYRREYPLAGVAYVDVIPRRQQTP